MADSKKRRENKARKRQHVLDVRAGRKKSHRVVAEETQARIDVQRVQDQIDALERWKAKHKGMIQNVIEEESNDS